MIAPEERCSFLVAAMGRARFIDRIEEMRAPTNVLAHVMVHEITHLLQGIGRHSATGVMKEVWTAGDFGGMRLRPLPFTPLDIDLIYVGLAAGRSSQIGGKRRK